MRGGWIYAYMAACTALVVLKACGIVDWPWEAVLAPIWVPALVAIALAFIALVLATMLAMIREEL